MKEGSLWKMGSMKGMTRTKPTPRPMFIPKLLPHGLTMLYGRPKIGKSWLVLDLARSLATGTEFLGQKARRATVLYYALNDHEQRMQDRMRKLGMTKKEREALYISFEKPDLNVLTRNAREFEVIIVDPLASITHGVKNDMQAGWWLAHELSCIANKVSIVVTNGLLNAFMNGVCNRADTRWILEKEQLIAQGRRMAYTENEIQFNKDAMKWEVDILS